MESISEEEKDGTHGSTYDYSAGMVFSNLLCKLPQSSNVSSNFFIIIFCLFDMSFDILHPKFWCSFFTVVLGDKIWS